MKAIKRRLQSLILEALEAFPAVYIMAQGRPVKLHWYVSYGARTSSQSSSLLMIRWNVLRNT
jgi:hypothetical protein